MCLAPWVLCVCRFCDQGSYRVLYSRKSLEIIFPQQFFRPGESLENRDSLEKMVKSLEFFESYNKCFTSETFFGAG